jgi:hypothetical protein
LSLFGSFIAVSAALFIAGDPRLIGLSSVVHLDAMLGLLVALCFASYVYAVETGRWKWKILSGVFFAGCLLIKPTCLSLPIVLFLYRLLRLPFVCSPRIANKSEKTLLSWSDVIPIAVAHTLVPLLWTRFWYHVSEFRTRLMLRFRPAGHTWKFGNALQDNPSLTICVIAVLVGGAFWAMASYKKYSKRLHYHLAFLLISFACLLSLLALFPQVFENFIRYYGWVTGLVSTPHQAFGKIVKPLEWGYAGMFLTENLSAIVLLYPIGVALALWRYGKTLLEFREQKNETDDFYLFTRSRVILLVLAILPIAWMLFLSVSPKQAWRYAIPSYFAIAITSAAGLQAMLASVFRSKASAWKAWALCILASFLLVNFIRSYPNYNFHFSSVSGGMQGAIERGQGFWFPGQKSIARAIVKDIDKQDLGGLVLVSVFGDLRTLKATLLLHFSKYRQRIAPGYFSPDAAHYLVVYASHRHLVTPEYRRRLKTLTPIFAYHVDGVEVAWLYRLQGS